MDKLPENWTYPLIQSRLIEKYLQIEKQSYSQIQQTAKLTMDYIKKMIMPGINLLEIRKLCEEKLLESGADSFWYWDVGAFVFSGDETTVSISGKQYVTSDKEIENNDIITIDLSPQAGNIWGDYARTVVVENGFVNLDFMGNLGHSIVKAKDDRVYIEKGNLTKLADVKYFTFEPHIAFPGSKYGYKKENIYYFDGDCLTEL